MKQNVNAPVIWCLVLLMKVILIRSQVSPDATVLPTSCREVVYPTATNPIDCARVTRGDIGMVNDLMLDDDWDTVADVGGTPVNGFYDTILKQWVQSPTGPTSNPASMDSGNKLLPNELPGSCRYDINNFLFDPSCFNFLPDGTWNEAIVSETAKPVCVQLPSSPAQLVIERGNVGGIRYRLTFCSIFHLKPYFQGS